MQITDVRVRKVAKEGKLKAVVSITMDEEFVVHDIKVIEGEKGLFIAMPSKKAVDGEYRDIAHPINSRTKEGTLENYMVKDARTNTSRICSAKENGSKIARLHYDTVPVTDWLFTAPAAFHGTELEIHLDTGRHHQIRVQLASVGCPIVGDTKYNQELSDTTGWQTIRLCAYKLDFKHPLTHKAMHFQ